VRDGVPLGLKRAWLNKVEERLKPLAPLVLLLLCYSNASACLPQALGTPDWDFLLVTFGCVLGLCILTFSCGYLIGRLLDADHDQRAALMFGLGMSNNGTGQVLASVALASYPLVLLPIIAYNISQHLAAGCVHALLRREAERYGHSTEQNTPERALSTRRRAD
jgi:BASS family bile acid:Na+ symporter